MKDFKILKFIITLVIGIIASYVLYKVMGLQLVDSLMISACFIIAYSFTFLHTMFGQNASNRGSIYNQYQKTSYDMKYNIREDRGYIPETLFAGLLLFVGSLTLLFK